MLTITIPTVESFDDATQKFVYSGGATLQLEHSLASLSKWESKWEKPFLGPGDRSTEEVVGYVMAMTLTPDVDPEVYDYLSRANMDDINAYMNAKMTATWINETPKKGPVEIITAELIYYWMVSHTIPFETQHWHLNKLLMLIRVCNKKNAPEKEKQSPRELAEQRQKLNAERMAKYNTKG